MSRWLAKLKRIQAARYQSGNEEAGTILQLAESLSDSDRRELDWELFRQVEADPSNWPALYAMSQRRDAQLAAAIWRLVPDNPDPTSQTDRELTFAAIQLGYEAPVGFYEEFMRRGLAMAPSWFVGSLAYLARVDRQAYMALASDTFVERLGALDDDAVRILDSVEVPGHFLILCDDDPTAAPELLEAIATTNPELAGAMAESATRVLDRAETNQQKHVQNTLELIAPFTQAT